MVMKRIQTFIYSLLALAFCVQIQAQIGTFRFAQLTDIHLSENNPNPTEDLLRSIAQINATDSLDFVLVTGDITEEGDNATLHKVKQCLDLLRYPYYTVMGNHETKWSESGCTMFAKIFGGERFSFFHKGIQFLGFNTGPFMRMAFGHVKPQDISWIQSTIKDKKQPVILVTHYPILEGDVDNWYELTDAIKPYNIRLFVGGHYHRNKQSTYDGIPGVLIRTNLRDKDALPGYGIYEVSPDSIIVYQQRIGEKKQLICAYSLTNQLFNHDKKADNYPDFSVNKTYPNVKRQWCVQTGTAIYSSPVVEGNKVFVGDDAGILTSYNLKTGKKLWAYQSGNRIVGTPAVENGIVVFGSADQYIYGIDAKNGSLKWRVQAEAPVLGAVTIQQGIAYIGSSDHIFRAIDIQNGKVVWTYNNVKGYVETKPLVTNNQVIFGAWDNTLYSLNQKNGHENWRWTGNLTRMHFSPAAVWPVATQNRVFIVDPERALTAIDLTTGATIWRTYQSKVRETIGLSADQTRIYAKTMQDSVVCYSATSEQPKQLWRANLQFGYEHATSMMAEQGDVVLGSTKDGLIFGLQAKTGEIRWKHKIGNSLINTVVPVGRRQLLVTAASGELCLLQYR